MSLSAKAPRELSRREFCTASALATGALLVQAYMLPAASATRRHGAAPAQVFVPNAFLRIDPDGRVTITVARPEVGQGVRTSLPMLVAEELDADWTAIRIEQAPTVDHDAYGDQYAGGSQSVSHGWDLLRHAGAVARTLLVRAAAQQWGVDPQACETSRGVVAHAASGRRLSYGVLTASAAKLPVPAEVSFKEASRYTILGRPTRQLDAPAIVNGTQRYGLDVRVPGMRFAAIERAPVLGARIGSFDDRAARTIAGVREVVRIDADSLPGFGDNSPRPANGVAVIADSTWVALQARKALRISWSGGAASEDSERQRMECKRLAATAPERIVRNDGDVDRACAAAAHVAQATYELPLVAHAPMEPMNCTAAVVPGHCTLWVPTQNPADARKVAAAICGLQPQRVTVNVTRGGGGFGRRFYSDFVGEATVLARRAGAPVQVVWTREDDMRNGYYRPASYHSMRAALDGRGRLIAWSQHLIHAQRGDFLKWAPPQGATELPAGDELGTFDFPAGFIPNLRLMASAIRGCAVPLGQWRSVEDSSNVFVYQSFIDELAHTAGCDPLAYRLELLSAAPELPYYGGRYYPARLRQVLQVAARESAWGKPLPAGWGRGVACSYANHAYVALVAEVEVDAKQEIRAHRVVAVADLGTVINPLGATGQIEGAILFGLSAALKHEITVADGRVVQGNFTDFPLIRMSEAPQIEVHLVSGGGAPLGCGETGVPPTAPAVANAVFAATGIRARRLPIRLRP